MPSKDPDTIQAQQVAYREANRAKLRLKAKLYYKKNKAKTQAYRLANKDSIKARYAAYWIAHKEALTLAHKARMKAHPEYDRTKNATRKARKRGAMRRDLTHAQWQAIQLAQDHRCAYCAKRCKGRLTQDHITPLSKGGAHTLHNVIGACASCNSKKHTGPPLVPVQPLLL